MSVLFFAVPLQESDRHARNIELNLAYDIGLAVKDFFALDQALID